MRLTVLVPSVELPFRDVHLPLATSPLVVDADIEAVSTGNDTEVSMIGKMN